MKYLTIALLAVAGSSQVWAFSPVTAPDGGSSLLLPGVGVAAVSGLRRAFRR